MGRKKDAPHKRQAKKLYVEIYLQQFKATQLRYNNKTMINAKYKENTKNFGESKGLTCDRVLIYPTTQMLKWIKNNKSELKTSIRSKLYVAITRARYSVGIVIDDGLQLDVEGIKYYYDTRVLIESESDNNKLEL